MSEAERSSACMSEGVGGLLQPEGIAARCQIFAQARQATPGVAFLVAAVSYAREWLGFSDGDFLQELVEGVLGCNYPSPARMSYGQDRPTLLRKEAGSNETPGFDT